MIKNLNKVAEFAGKCNKRNDYTLVSQKKINALFDYIKDVPKTVEELNGHIKIDDVKNFSHVAKQLINMRSDLLFLSDVLSDIENIYQEMITSLNIQGK